MKNFAVSKKFDFFIVLIFLWLPLSVGLFYLAGHLKYIEIILIIFASVSSSLHRSLSITTCLVSPYFKLGREKDSFTFIFIPILSYIFIAAVTLYAIYFPEFRWPLLLIFAVCFTIYSSWHTAAQHFGMLSMYRYNSNDISKINSYMDRSLGIVVTFLLIYPLLATAYNNSFGQIIWSAGITTKTWNQCTQYAKMIAFIYGAIYMIIFFKSAVHSWGRCAYAFSLLLLPILILYFQKFILCGLSIWLIQHALVEIGLQVRFNYFGFKKNKNLISILFFFIIQIFAFIFLYTSILQTISGTKLEHLVPSGYLNDNLILAIQENIFYRFLVITTLGSALSHLIISQNFYNPRNQTAKDLVLSQIKS